MDENERKRLLREHRRNMLIGEAVGVAATAAACWLLVALILGAVRELS